MFPHILALYIFIDGVLLWSARVRIERFGMFLASVGQVHPYSVAALSEFLQKP